MNLGKAEYEYFVVNVNTLLLRWLYCLQREKKRPGIRRGIDELILVVCYILTVFIHGVLYVFIDCFEHQPCHMQWELRE